MAITFDPTNKRIILDSANVEAGYIYSRWKEWVQTGNNAKYEQAFSVLGGDPLGGGLFVASYYFLMNGWRIRPMETNHTLVINGTITAYGGGQPVVNTLGNYNVSVQYTVPVQAQGIATAGGGGADTAAIIAALSSFLASTMVQANIKEIADKPLRSWNGSEWV